MYDFERFFRMDTAAAVEYAVSRLAYFTSEEKPEAEEIGDGNINYVFRLHSPVSGRSLILKQADVLLRSSGRPLKLRRSLLEASLLQLENELAPGFVPEVYHYDEVMAVTAMEDVSAYGNLRRELAAGHVYGHLAEQISEFLVRTLLPTTDLVMPAAKKKELAGFYINPELCNITEELVLKEPYYDPAGRNILTPGNEDYVREHLYENHALITEAALLRERFMNEAQALLHGDLHTGSIFANGDGIKVLDPEFAFYGPMGYDIGNVIGNFLMAWAAMLFGDRAEEKSADGEAGTAEAILETAVRITDLVREKLAKLYDELVTLPMYREEGFRTRYLSGIMADSMGYAGTEIIRRTVGHAKIPEFRSVTVPERRIAMERMLIRLGTALVMERGGIADGEALRAAAEEALHGTDG